MNNKENDFNWGKARERIAAQLFIDSKYPGASLTEAPDFADLDFGIVSKSGRMLPFLEVKVRKIRSDQYKDSPVHVLKHEAAKCLRKHFKLRTICLVVFTDLAGWFDLSEKPNYTKMLKRHDRDKEVPHAFYTVTQWVEGLPEALEKEVARRQAEADQDDTIPGI